MKKKKKAEIRVRNQLSIVFTAHKVPQTAVKIKGNYRRLNKQDIKTGP